MTTTKMILATAVMGYGLANSAWAEQTPIQDKRLVRSPYMFLDVNVDEIVPGQSVTVNVYLQDVDDLAAYQVQLATEGGLSGGLALDTIQIKQRRADFVFAGNHVVAAGDRRSMRAGAVSMDGGVSADQPAYIATFTFHATAEADGLFDIYISLESQTLLRDSVEGPILLDVGPGVSIAVRGDPQNGDAQDTHPIEEQNTDGGAANNAAADNAAAGPGCAGGPVNFAYILGIVNCFKGMTAPGPATDISPCGVGDGVCSFSDILCAVTEFTGIVPGCP